MVKHCQKLAKFHQSDAARDWQRDCSRTEDAAARNLLQVDGALYVATNQGLLIFDVRDPRWPRHIQTLYAGQAMESLSMQGSTLFARTAAAGTSRTVSFDVSEPQKPVLRSDGQIDLSLEGSIHNPTGRFVGKAVLGVAGTHLGIGVIMIAIGGYQHTHPDE